MEVVWTMAHLETRSKRLTTRPWAHGRDVGCIPGKWVAWPFMLGDAPLSLQIEVALFLSSKRLHQKQGSEASVADFL